MQTDRRNVFVAVRRWSLLT